MSHDEDADSDEVDLQSSELGTHAYWQQAYTRELDALEELGDEGEIWFGEDTMETMLDFLDTLMCKGLGGKQREDVDVLDVGTGNGALLVGLARRGYKRLMGSDYSAVSVDLAAAVLAKHGLGGSVRLVVDDVLHTALTERFDIVTDKGTLDAIGLSASAARDRPLYVKSVADLLHPGGLLVLTTCNSTRDELIEEFCESRPPPAASFNGHRAVADPAASGQEGAGAGLLSTAAHAESSQEDSAACRSSEPAVGLHSSDAIAEQPSDAEIRSAAVPPDFEVADWVRTYPTFRFGGVEGTCVCTVAFRRKVVR